MGSPPACGAKYTWGIKISRFSTNKSHILQTIQDIVIVTMEGEYKLVCDHRIRVAIYQMVTFPMTLNEP